MKNHTRLMSLLMIFSDVSRTFQLLETSPLPSIAKNTAYFMYKINCNDPKSLLCSLLIGIYLYICRLLCSLS